MRRLLLKLFRDIRQSLGQFIAIVVVIAVGAFFYAGLITYSDNLNAYTKAYFKEHNLSDLNVYYGQITKQDVADLSDIEGIRKIEGRYTADATQAFEGYKASIKVHSIPEENEINTPMVMEGTLPSNKEEILLDSHYAQEHGFRVGDRIEINSNNKDYGYTISGLGENVEYVKKNEIQDHKNFGVAYLAEEAIPELAGGLTYNEVLIDAEEGYNLEELSKTIEARSKPLPYLNQVSKERSFGYSKLNETVHNNGLMSKVIPFVLFLIGAIILFLTMSRIIDSQRNQVGIMKALGVKNRTIMLHYMGYPLLTGTIGSILGCALAAMVFIPLITESSSRAYALPDIQFALSFYSILPPIAFSSAFGILSCYLSGRSVLRERAAQAMRPKPPKKTKMLLLERIPGLWGRIPYSYKLILRNILLNKRKAIASSVGVVASTVLLITAFGTQAALLKVANQIEEVNVFDLRVDYSIGASPDSSELPSGIQRKYDLTDFPVDYIEGDKKEKATLTVTDKENPLIRFFDGDRNPISQENDGVLVPQSYADKYHISEGDLVRIAFTAPEFNQKTIEMKVSKVSAQYSNPSFYITPDYLKSFGLDYRPSSLLVETDGSANLAGVRDFFEKDPQVDKITDKNDLKKSAQYIMKQNNFVFIMFIVCAVILSFGAIYTISSINIYERNRELATLKVLGYPKFKINGLIFSENILLTTLAVIVSIPISGYMYAVVIEALSSVHQQIPDKLNVLLLLAAVVLSYLLTILANLLLRSKVSRIPMIESLKSIE